MFGKVFDSIFSSSLVAEGGWLPTYIFMSMVAIADKDGYVREAPKAMFRRLGFREYESKVSYDEFIAAIDYLCQPDPESNTPDSEGRRVIPLSEIDDNDRRGWWIVNYTKYREKGGSTDRVRRHRESNKNKDIKNGVTVSPLQNVSVTYTDTDTDRKNIKKRTSAPREFPVTEAMKSYAKSKGVTSGLEAITEHFLTHHRAKGTTFVDWYAAWQNWLRKHVEFNPPAPPSDFRGNV